MISFKNLNVIATTLRKVITANSNDWSAIAWSKKNGFIKSINFPGLDIYDRVGGGDGFASGFIYGIIEGLDLRDAINLGTAHGALAMTTPGDTSMVSIDEVKNLIKNLNDKKMVMTIEDESDEEAIVLAFKKDRANDRKRWIKKATGKEIYLDPSLKKVNIKQFIDEELVLFSIEDCERSIPSMMDGLKPSQRKVLYGSLLKNIKDEIKVDQLRGFIGEKAAYHHGEMSLNETIMGMNANYVGSNNINLFKPGGQLGTRLMGGKDAASPRYIFTKLSIPFVSLIKSTLVSNLVAIFVYFCVTSTTKYDALVNFI